jgi:hypothetical protein
MPPRPELVLDHGEQLRRLHQNVDVAEMGVPKLVKDVICSDLFAGSLPPVLGPRKEIASKRLTT